MEKEGKKRFPAKDEVILLRTQKVLNHRLK